MSNVLQTDRSGAPGKWFINHYGEEKKKIGGRTRFLSAVWDVKKISLSQQSRRLWAGARNHRLVIWCARVSVEGSEGCQDALSDPPSARHLAERPQAGVVLGAHRGAGALQGGHRSSHLQADLPEGPVSGYLRAGQQHHADRGERTGGRHAHGTGLQGRWVTVARLTQRRGVFFLRDVIRPRRVTTSAAPI